jgi:hypothetical protein
MGDGDANGSSSASNEEQSADNDDGQGPEDGPYDDASNTTGEARSAAVEQVRLMLAIALAAE